jgi:hypothetical protein
MVSPTPLLPSHHCPQLHPQPLQPRLHGSRKFLLIPATIGRRSLRPMMMTTLTPCLFDLTGPLLLLPSQPLRLILFCILSYLIPGPRAISHWYAQISPPLFRFLPTQLRDLGGCASTQPAQVPLISPLPQGVFSHFVMPSLSLPAAFVLFPC